MRVDRPELEVAEDPVAEHVGIGLRHADHVSDEMHRDVLGVVARSVGDVRAVEALDQLAAVATRLVLERIDGLGTEGRQEETAMLVVLGRVGRDRGRRTDRRVGMRHRDPERREVLGVVGHLGDRVVADRHPGPAVALGERDFASGVAQRLPDLGCLRPPRRVEPVPIAGPVGDRSAHHLIVGVIVGVVRHRFPLSGNQRRRWPFARRQRPPGSIPEPTIELIGGRVARFSSRCSPPARIRSTMPDDGSRPAQRKPVTSTSAACRASCSS